MDAVLIETTMVSSDLVMQGTLLHDEPMARHTSWKTGGRAERYYIPANLDDLSLFLSQLNEEEEILWLGLGSNLLVRDGGLKGTVIATTGVLDEMSVYIPGVQVGSGLTCAKAARFSARNGLSGAEFLAGIPGTIGGALAMNAGAFGAEMWDIVSKVEIIDRSGHRRIRQSSEFEIGYRSVSIADNEWFISAILKLENDGKQRAQSNIRDLLSRRAESQPIGEHSCGSVFRNPKGDYAARLIESCGLKGKSIGGARVSEKHANFIVNTGDANSREIEELILFVKETVQKKCQVELETEVRIVGSSE
jgi:UDP-N-acetylmuramate dehydrogenase